MGFDIFKCSGNSKMEYALTNVPLVEVADKRNSLHIHTILGLQFACAEVQHPLLISSHFSECLAEASGLRLYALHSSLHASFDWARRLSMRSDIRYMGSGSTKVCEMYRLDHRFEVDCGV
jgi:hypothetical protein